MQQGKPPQQKMPKMIQSPNKPSFKLPRSRTSPSGELSLPLGAHRYSICLLLSLVVGPKIICRFTHRATSPCHRNVPRVPPEQVLMKILPFACPIPPLKFGQIFYLFFITQGAAPRKGSAKPPPTLTES